MSTATVTVEDYARAYAEECSKHYPQIDAFEERLGYSIHSERPGALEDAARTLACPVKRNPPNWQHGRIIYSVARDRLSTFGGFGIMLDIGTAKGFSALCLAWAIADADSGLRGVGRVVTLDSVHPNDRVHRNSVSELAFGRYLTVGEFLAPWPEAGLIHAIGTPSHQWLAMNRERIALAFIDGKHTYAAVAEDLDGIKHHQESGDVIIADDLQVDGVAQAVAGLRGYDLTLISAHRDRQYAVATKQ
jgi:hypothetical protein